MYGNSNIKFNVKILHSIEADNSIHFYVFPRLFYPSVLCNYANICSLKISKHITWILQSMLFPLRQRASHGLRNKIFKSNIAASCNLILRYTSSFLRKLYVYTCYSHAVFRDSSGGIVTIYELDGPGIESWWGARFSAHVQTGPGAYPSSYTMGTGSFPEVKRPGRGVDHPPPSSAEVIERPEPYLYSRSGSS
jgi:hypothetical protein